MKALLTPFTCTGSPGAGAASGFGAYPGVPWKKVPAAEGHATWIQRQINPAFDPIVAAKVDRSSDRKLQNYKGSFDLERWGSVQPKREAIMRQVSAEDRARMNADPNYNPTGSFTFRPDDFEGDMAADAASYPAANAIFVGLARKYGVSAV
jgi:hypothetical protein